jgi:hypothetical protein
MNMKQTWANYYSHITKDATMQETHEILEEERKTQRDIIRRAQEHLDGVNLFYKQSPYTDPNPSGEEKKENVSHFDGCEPVTKTTYSDTSL